MAVNSGRTADALDTKSSSDLDVPRARLDHLDDKEIAWQIEIIRQNSSAQRQIRRGNLAGRRQNTSLYLNPARGSANASLYRRSRSHIQRTISVCDPTRSGRRLDRPGLAGRCGGFSARVLGPRPVQRHVRNCCLSCGTRRNEVERLFGRIGATGSRMAHLRKNLPELERRRMARSLGTGGAVGPLARSSHALCVMSNCLKTGEPARRRVEGHRISSPMRSLPRTPSSWTSWGEVPVAY